MRWYDDPILVLGMGLLGLSLILAGLVGVCLILLWYARKRQNYQYDRLPINWGEPLIQERKLTDDVVDLNVAEIQNDLISALAERDALRHELARAESRYATAERARRRHLATARRLQRNIDGAPLLVPELWSQDLSPVLRKPLSS